MTDKHGEGSHGTRNKRFLDQNEVLSLAVLIADEQEHKSQTKTDKIKHWKQAADRRHHTPAKSKSRLEERKAALAAQLAQAKRDHARSRKQRQSKTISKHGNAAASSSDQRGKQTRKSVSFSSHDPLDSQKN